MKNTAEEIFKLAQQSESKIAEVEAQPFLKLIREAADDGEFSIEVGTISPRIQRYLYSIGYNIKKSHENCQIIDWNPRQKYYDDR